MDKIYCVYAHINKINGKIYIGQTKNINRRWRSNGIEYEKSTYFYNRYPRQKYLLNNTNIERNDNMAKTMAELIEILTAKENAKRNEAKRSVCWYHRRHD